MVSALEEMCLGTEDGESKLDAGEVWQLLNLNPRDEEELLAYIPTLKRFNRDYQLTFFVNDDNFA